MHDEYYDDTDADYHTTDYIPKMRIVFRPLFSDRNFHIPPTISNSWLVENPFRKRIKL